VTAIEDRAAEAERWVRESAIETLPDVVREFFTRDLPLLLAVDLAHSEFHRDESAARAAVARIRIACRPLDGGGSARFVRTGAVFDTTPVLAVSVGDLREILGEA
jgi:hypothetical protein